ncbi:kinase domain protein (macronuclear) [Tetrahymena thermophila SB210]|uniref:Kinase domain protein n=1 Tax=Tetrahymena thermophila (strain SB210) TaxID=312017 RepID=Q239N8_TETTS|nr:kinase domain protein [Tetrahymena thermophila SB210]EAR93232.2 kinase domain protein [Tetrahymena thermophila SB210]|eukprot:XP_001013477.2 kinase domain protein [Tetrahymena thermophila SB210]
MSKKVQNDLIEIISSKVSQDCQIQRPAIKELVNLMFSQKKYFKNYEYLSNGDCAIILKAYNSQKSRKVALKFLGSSNQKDKNGIESLKKEYEMLQMFSQSEFLVNFYDCFYLMEEKEDEDTDGNDIIVQTGVKSFFVMEMELCENNLKQLFDFLRKQQVPPPKEMKEIIAIQMIDGLNNLHVKNIMHRDIKPSNFLVCTSKEYGFSIKLCDLGFASAVSKSKSFLSKKGTAAYFAPEVEEGKSRIQSDLFSLGLALLELDNLKTLNENWIDTKTKNYLFNGEEIPKEKYQIDKNSNIYKIAKICLQPWYLDRITAGELLSSLIQMHGQP